MRVTTGIQVIVVTVGVLFNIQPLSAHSSLSFSFSFVKLVFHSTLLFTSPLNLHFFLPHSPSLVTKIITPSFLVLHVSSRIANELSHCVVGRATARDGASKPHHCPLSFRTNVSRILWQFSSLLFGSSFQVSVFFIIKFYFIYIYIYLERVCYEYGSPTFFT